jgi:tetratricopeptide (TPR) repeat protein
MAMILRISAIAIACAVAIFGVDQLCIRPWRASVVLREVEQRSALAESLDPARATALAHTNLHDLDSAAEGSRLNPEWYLLYSANCEILGRWEDAAAANTRALQIDDRPEIYVNRGMAMLHLGRADAAVSDLAIAARFDPKVLDDLDGELRSRVAEAARLR